jgi:hypothetical protein
MASLTYLEPLASGYIPIFDTSNSTDLWHGLRDNQDAHPRQALAQSYSRSPVHQSATNSNLSEFTTSISDHSPSSTPSSMTLNQRTLSNQTSTPTGTRNDSVVATQPGESEKTRRARYAANQRHKKAQQTRKNSHQRGSTSEASDHAVERKQGHREKNKVAAAKCRTRQRKQVQTIQESSIQLGEKNLKLKTLIQELRGQLNSLRSMALDHRQCNCHVASYNHLQAERVVAKYRSTRLLPEVGGFTFPLHPHDIPSQ